MNESTKQGRAKLARAIIIKNSRREVHLINTHEYLRLHIHSLASVIEASHSNRMARNFGLKFAIATGYCKRYNGRQVKVLYGRV